MSVEERVELLKSNIRRFTHDLLHYDVVEIRLLDRMIRARRGKAMQITVGVSLALGALPLLVFTQSLPLLLFMVVAVSTAVAQLR